jgi:hypothetical protein
MSIFQAASFWNNFVTSPLPRTVCACIMWREEAGPLYFSFQAGPFFETTDRLEV